jgi:hypothetical protein
MENKKNEQILSLVSKAHQQALQKAIDFMENPTQQTAEAVAEVMNELFEIKQNMRKRDEVVTHLDYVIKYAVRATIDFPSTQKFFDVKTAHKNGKITNSEEMLKRLLQHFNNPIDFVSCIDFNYNNLKKLMGDKFMNDNSDIISESDVAPAVYMRKDSADTSK